MAVDSLRNRRQIRDSSEGTLNTRLFPPISAFPRRLQVPHHLQVQPELWRGAEYRSEVQSSFSRYAALATNQFIEASSRPTDACSESHLGLSGGPKEFFQKHLARMSRLQRWPVIGDSR
jgi:hypothetical protein